MKAFIHNKIETAIKVYETEPKRIRQDYRLEQASIKNYQGREIFELIQNADDEMIALDKAEAKRIKICYSNGVLSVSNNGNPFDEDGVESLMLAFNSEKQERQNKSSSKQFTPTIGYKGTGFRAVFSWAKKVQIDSGDLHICFSAKHSQSVLDERLGEKAKGYKAAILAFPEWNSNYSISEKYTTVITLFLKNETNISERVLEQLRKLDGESLLFLNHTMSFEINVDGKVTLFKRIKHRDSSVIEKYIDGKLVESVEWYLQTKKGMFNEKQFSISVAFRKDGIAPKKQRVYCYLPTDVELPLPILLHGDFDLDDTRNHLIKESQENEHVIYEAVNTIIESAINRTQMEKVSTYNPLKMIIPDSNTSGSELAEFGFYDRLLDLSSKSKLLPTVNNTYIDLSAHPVWYDEPIADFLSGEGFEHLLRHTDDPNIKSYLKTEPFIKYKYNAAYFTRNINSWSKKRKQSEKIIEENCRLIHALYIDNSADYDNLELIYCDDGTIATSKNPIFIHTTDESIHLPSFIRVKRIDTHMETRLKELFDCDNSYLVDKLSSFNLVSFTVADIIRKMGNSIDSRLNRNEKEKAKNCIKESIKWLWLNSDSFSKSDIDDIKIKLISRKGNIVDSKQLYLGSEFDTRIAEDLFVGFSEDVFVERCHFEVDDYSKLREFYYKLGVTDKPRDVFHDVNTQDFDKKAYGVYLWNTAKYPVHCEECLMYKDSKYKAFIGNVHSYEHLDWILNNSSTESILQWIYSDDNLKACLMKKYDKQMELKSAFDSLTKYRVVNNHDIMPYVLWKFTAIPWLEVNDQRYVVTDCIFEDVPISLSEIMVKPDVSKYTASLMSLTNTECKRLLVSIGAMDSFKDLPSSKVYQMLNRLFDLNEIKYTKTFYQKLYDVYDETSIDSKDLAAFIESGHILCRDEIFYPVKECKYLERRAFCRIILKKFHLMNIRTRLSVPKMSALFGVEKLDIKGEIIGVPSVHRLNSVFQNNLNHYKACVACYRYGDNISKSNTEINRLKNLKISICNTFDASINGERIELCNYDYIMQDASTYYIKVPVTLNDESDLINHDMGDAVSGIICDMFDLRNEKTPLRDLYMKSINDRERAVQDETEDNSILEEAKREIASQIDCKDEFVEILTLHANADAELLSSYIDKIDFDNINAYGNYKQIIELFRTCSFDISDYNEHSVLLSLDLKSYYESQVYNYKRKYENTYKTRTYKKLQEGSLDEKETLVDLWYDYLDTSIQVEDSVYFDTLSAFLTYFDLDGNISETLDLDGIYKKNLKHFESLLSEKVDLNDFYSNNRVTSLLYFGEYEKLLELYNLKVDKATKKDGQSDQLPENASLKVNYGTTVPAKVSNGKSRKQVGFNEKKSKEKNNKRDGYLGEYKVYLWLVKHFADVNWVSENAKIANVNQTGSADNGYDISYKDGDVEYFVDVKSTSSDSDTFTFYMTSSELEFARRNEESYRIFFVSDVLSDEPQVTILTNIIKDGSLNEEAFDIKADTKYTIRGELSAASPFSMELSDEQ